MFEKKKENKINLQLYKIYAKKKLFLKIKLNIELKISSH
jgi:hypothetical protein